MSEILEYNYQEMVRLAEKCEGLIKSSFDDFKLLGALGVLLAWKPLEEKFITNPQITLYGFLAIAVITTLISHPLQAGLFKSLKARHNIE